jgi:NTE family protein
MTMKRATRPESPPRIVLVLPGGGALGAYQAGVYEAMSSSGLEPDWLIGTSIGAINSALIAGNPKVRRLERLREFWRRVGQDSSPGNWSIITGGVPAFFTPRLGRWAIPGARLGLEQAAYYSTEPLRRTLEELVDLDLPGQGGPRLTVGAVGVASGQMKYFDSRDTRLGVQHVMASGALPPAFPAVRIDGEAYWDGGIYSNTPIEPIFDDLPRRDSLIFAANLWQPQATEPQSVWEVMTRHKDIQFSSRAGPFIARLQKIHRLRRALHKLMEHWPQGAQDKRIPEWDDLEAEACDSTMHVVRLLAPTDASEDFLKDADFSRAGIRRRWTAGYEDTQRAIERAPWKDPADPMQGLIVHEALPRDLTHSSSSLLGK